MNLHLFQPLAKNVSYLQEYFFFILYIHARYSFIAIKSVFVIVADEIFVWFYLNTEDHTHVSFFDSFCNHPSRYDNHVLIHPLFKFEFPSSIISPVGCVNFPPPLSLPIPNANVSNNKCKLSDCLKNTLVFKYDKDIDEVGLSMSNRRAEWERRAAARFLPHSPFIITTFFRAACDEEKLLPPPPPPPPPLVSHRVRRNRQVIAAAVTATTTSVAAPLSVVVPKSGIVMERCVGTLADAFRPEISSSFTEELKFIQNTNKIKIFGWQPTHKHASIYDDSRPTFVDLSVATYQRLIGDLHSPIHRLHHFLHLAKSVHYMHLHGIAHGDLKPQNIFVRVLDSDHWRVHSVQLVLADFDCCTLFPFNKDGSVNWNDQEEDYTAPAGTFGYHPNIFHPTVPYEVLAHKYLQIAPPCEKKEEPAHTYYSIYSKINDRTEPSIDVFSLGMIYLSIIHSVSINSGFALWIKKQIQTCPSFPSSSSSSSSSSSCSPGHVLLHHRIDKSEEFAKQLDLQATSTGYVPCLMASYNFLRYSGYNGIHESYNKIIESIARDINYNNTPMVRLYELIVRMTLPNKSDRPSALQCINSIESIIMSISTS
jgi:hypothetical protein